MIGRRRFVTGAVLLVALVGVATLAGFAANAGGRPDGAAASERYRSVFIEGVPHVEQRPDFCGEACVEMWLRKLGHDVDQRAVFDLTGVDPAEGRGAWTRDLVKSLRALGFTPGDVWYRVPVASAPARVERQWALLHADLLRGVPSIVCMRTSARAGATEHFRLILGYDAATDSVIYHEPAETNGAAHRMPRSRFMDLWPLHYDVATWTVIRMRLASGALQLPPATKGLRDADFALRVMELRERLPAGFTVIVERPFVVIGDEAPDVVRRRATGTVRWATQKLKRRFFARDPDEIIDIWLFRNEESYRSNARALFGHEPHTPFGYSSPSDHALVMNIATGGGTLVHEIVHPFVRANFPDCPAWFNEGLGSLYEQCGEKDDGIHGYTNWRLAGLQDAIREDTVPSFRTLTGTSDEAFYDEDPGTNYAQARYLCYYLQQRGLLERFYREFHAHHGADPTGYATLKRVLGEKDMAAFQERWQAWVLELSFP